MNITTLEVGALGVNCYIVSCPETKIGAIIDPGDEAHRIMSCVRDQGLQIKYIVNTHGHGDHIGANSTIKEATGAELLIHGEDAGMLLDPGKNLSHWMGVPFVSPKADRTLRDKEILSLGNLELEVLHTPGHTRGGICLKGDGVVFVGDTLFAGSVGRTDFPGGSYGELMHSIREKLLTLPDDTVVYSGHGPATTIGAERAGNPFLV